MAHAAYLRLNVKESSSSPCSLSCASACQCRAFDHNMKSSYVFNLLSAWLVYLVGAVEGQTVESLLSQTPQCAVRDASALPNTDHD